jgi:glycosyltransferase EpsF
MKSPRRVLHVVSAMERGGAETLLMNIYRNIDRTNIQFDFVSHRKEKCDYDDEIISLGGNVYRVSSLGQMGPLAYIKQLKKIITSQNYSAVHAHTDYQCGFPALAAKLAGIKRRICHAHSNNWPKGRGLRQQIALKALQMLIKYSASDYCACSVEAGRFLFGQSSIDRGQVRVIKNGIEISQFIDQDLNNHSSVKHEFNIPQESKVIGHIGRFSESKNHAFLLKVLKRLVEEKQDIVAILVGDGPLRKDMEEEARKLGILSNIRFAGVRTDIPRLMKAFDVFLFPSLYEGFGIVTVEAQSCGTPCVASDSVPKNTDMGLGLITFISLNEDVGTWSQEITKSFMKETPSKNEIRKNISKLGFDIQKNIPEWMELYG